MIELISAQLMRVRKYWLLISEHRLKTLVWNIQFSATKTGKTEKLSATEIPKFDSYEHN